MAIGIAQPFQGLADGFGLTGQIDDQCPTANDRGLTRKNGGWYEMSADTAHFLAKSGHFAISHGKCRFGRDIARRRPRATGSQHQMAAGAIDQFDQGGLNLTALVGDETRFNLERFHQRAL